MQANGWAKRGAVCSRDARLAGVRRWARPYAGRVGGASCVGGARAQAFALSEAAASVIRNGRLTMAYRSRKSFFSFRDNLWVLWDLSTYMDHGHGLGQWDMVPWIGVQGVPP